MNTEVLDKKEFGGHTLTLAHGLRPETSQEEIDLFLNQLKSKKEWWARDVTYDDQIDMLELMIRNSGAVAKAWAAADAKAKDVDHDHWDYAMSFIGPIGAPVIARAYIDALKGLRDQGVPKLYKNIEQEGDQVRLEVYPLYKTDSYVFQDVRGYTYLQPGTKEEDFDQYQIHADEYKVRKGGISLVLGAGNCASIAVADTLHKLFNDRSVVLLKIHPVLEYLYDTLQVVFEPFIKAGVLKLATGGSDLGKYVTTHPLVEDIHITGSDKTFDAIVYGPGAQGKENKRNDKKLNERPVMGELGCVTPLIVIPGDWSESDFDFQARTIISFLGFGGGYFCMTPRVLIMPKNWEGSNKLIALVKKYMQEVQLASSFYPGTQENIDAALKEYPQLEMIGQRDAHHQPWMFLTNLDPKIDQYAFSVEVWATFMAQVFLEGDSAEDFLKEAVKFANDKLWGNLSGIIIVDSTTEKRLAKSGALQTALKELRYGVVTLNIFPGIVYGLGVFPWGGYPGDSYRDIQSGNVFVNNPNLLKNIEKSVVYAPFHLRPETFALVTNPKDVEGFAMLAEYAASRSWKDIFKLVLTITGLRKERY